MTRLELAIEQKALATKLVQLTKQLEQWKSIFRNDARIYAENPTEDNKANMDISAKQVELNAKWAAEASRKYEKHVADWGLIWTELL